MEFEKLQGIIAEVLNVDADEITPDTTFVDDLGADSLDVFQIIMGIEEEFDIEIPHGEGREDCFCRRCGRGRSRLQSVEHYRKEELKEGLLQEPLFHL